MDASTKKNSVFVIGPTGSGKNDFALKVVTRSSGSIVNVDSVQIYKGLEVGANAPTAEEKSVCPHYLFNVLDPETRVTAGVLVREVESLLTQPDLQWPLYFVGGSGFYFRALEKGMPKLKPIPEAMVAEVKALEEALSPQALWEKLQELSPATAKKIHPNDSYRVQRALLLVLSQDSSPAEMEKALSSETSPLRGVNVRKVGLHLERDELKIRLQLRIEKMMNAGFVDEVKLLLERYKPSTPALQSIGYKEVVGYLQGQFSEEEMKAEILKSTMLLAKKQMIWFKRDTSVRWFHAVKETKAAEEFVLSP